MEDMSVDEVSPRERGSDASDCSRLSGRSSAVKAVRESTAKAPSAKRSKPWNFLV
jgi:hypothetical protein